MSELSLDDFAEAAMLAEADGLEVLVATNQQLFLDLDSEHARQQFNALKERVFPSVGAVELQQWASKSGNTHILINMESEQSLLHRVALQLVLGSDPLKEFLTIERWRCNDEKEDLVRLFRPPGPIHKEDLVGPDPFASDLRDFI